MVMDIDCFGLIWGVIFTCSAYSETIKLLAQVPETELWSRNIRAELNFFAECIALACRNITKTTRSTLATIQVMMALLFQ